MFDNMMSEVLFARTKKGYHEILNGRSRVRCTHVFQVPIGDLTEDGKVCIRSERGLLISRLMESTRV